MRFSCRRCARILSLAAVSLLGMALLVRAFAALVEAFAALLLVAVVAALALPHGLAWYWRRARMEIPRVLRMLSDMIEPAASKGGTGEPTEPNGQAGQAEPGGPERTDDPATPDEPGESGSPTGQPRPGGPANPTGSDEPGSRAVQADR